MEHARHGSAQASASARPFHTAHEPSPPASATEQEHRDSANRVACVCVQTRAHDANGDAIVAWQSAREHMEAVSTRKRTATLTFRRRTPTACRHTLETASSPTQTLQSTPQQTHRSLASRMAHGNASQPAGRTTAASSFGLMQRSWRQSGGLVESLQAGRPTAAHAARVVQRHVHAIHPQRQRRALCAFTHSNALFATTRPRLDQVLE
jgi:hypothetical protein